jgi:hypothetical protein
MEDDEHRYAYSAGSLKIDGYSDLQVSYHLKIMVQAGLLCLDVIEHSSPGSIVSGVSQPPHITTFRDYSLSWDGQEFLDAARDNTRWEKAKGTMAQAGGFALDVMKQLLIQYLKTELKLP